MASSSPRSMLDFAPFDALLKEPMQAVDRIITEQLKSDIPLIHQALAYIVQAGGKRLRPALTLLSGAALGCQLPALSEAAAMIECIHTATLLHDDVVDNASLRRGRVSANALFGNATSVLVGDFLYSRAFQMMVNIGYLPVLKVMSKATNIIAEGEVMQLMNIGNTTIDEATYLIIIQKKTAQLFEAAVEVAAIISGADAQSQSALMAYGVNLGIAFQLMDDALDYMGDTETMGKNLGADLAEGKPTLPFIFSMYQTDSSIQKTIKKALSKPNPKHLKQVLDIIQTCGALDYTKNKAKATAQRAIESVSALPKGLAKDALIKLAHLSYNRQF